MIADTGAEGTRSEGSPESSETSYLPEYGSAPTSPELDPAPVPGRNFGLPMSESASPEPAHPAELKVGRRPLAPLPPVKSDRRRLFFAAALAGVGITVAIVLGLIALGSKDRHGNDASAPPPVVTDEASPSPVADDAPLPVITYGVAGPEGQFGDGAYRVGVDVEPGTYRQVTPIEQESDRDSCYWMIYPGNDHSVKASIDFGSATGGLPILTLKESTEVVTAGCGDWVPVDPTNFFNKPDAPVGLPSGAWLIGDDFAPGVYRTAAVIDLPGRGYPCMWSVYTGASHSNDDIIEEDITVAGSPMVRLETGESFSSSYCGDWVSVDPTSLFQRTDAPATIPPGVWFGGEDFAPGTYEATPDFSVPRPSPYCSWSTSNPWYSRTLEDQDFDFSDEEGTRTVILSPGELFSSDGCGDWTRRGP